jgi:hypothetical protein
MTWNWKDEIFVSISKRYNLQIILTINQQLYLFHQVTPNLMQFNEQNLVCPFWKVSYDFHNIVLYRNEIGY